MLPTRQLIATAGAGLAAVATVLCTATAPAAAVPAPSTTTMGAIAPTTTAPTTAARAATTTPAISVVGSLGQCTTGRGALVAVDFTHWHGPVVRGCGAGVHTGAALLRAAGFTVTFVVSGGHDVPFVCRLAHPRFDHGHPRPAVSYQPCSRFPSARASWAYWIARKGSNTWTFSPTDVADDQPHPGEVEAWTFGPGKPSFTPARIRRGLSSHAVSTAGTPGAAGTASRQVNAAAAVRYLTDNLVGGTHYQPSGPGYTDYGLTIDAGLALAGHGGADSTLARLTRFVAAHADSWTGLGTADASGGSIGKEAVLVEATGHDPHSYAGHDLIGALDRLICTRASARTGCAGAGNFVYADSVFSQSLAVIAQLRAGDTAGAKSPVRFLEGVQHASGAFPSVLPGTGSDVDSTATAAMALALVDDATARTAVTKALAWLDTRQLADGGFPGTAGHSTNSTALAAQALGLDGVTYRDDIAAAHAFLDGLQNSDGGFPIAAGAGHTRSDVRSTAEVVGGLAGPSFGAVRDDVAGSDADPAAAADYLVGRLVGGSHLEYDGGYGPNYGGTADLAFGLAAAGGHDDALRSVVGYLAQHVADYADPAGTGQYPGPYTGAAGKLAVLAEATGQDPRAFGGFDLLQTLTHNVCAKADSAGACTAPGDFYQAFSTVSQAFGILALARAHVAVPGAALARLEQLQCADGGFSSTLIAAGADCTSDVDTTGLAVQALELVPSAATAVDTAVQYLHSAQQQDGGYSGAAGENTNSAALAVEGLLAVQPAATSTGVAMTSADADPAVTTAVQWLARHQNADGGFGVSDAKPASDVLATTQAVPAVAFATLTTLTHPIRLGAGGGSSPTPTAGTSAVPSATASSSAASGPAVAAAGNPADTGTDTAGLLGLAVLLLLGGAALLLATRHRPAPERRH